MITAARWVKPGEGDAVACPSLRDHLPGKSGIFFDKIKWGGAEGELYCLGKKNSEFYVLRDFCSKRKWRNGY